MIKLNKHNEAEAQSLGIGYMLKDGRRFTSTQELVNIWNVMERTRLAARGVRGPVLQHVAKALARATAELIFPKENGPVLQHVAEEIRTAARRARPNEAADVLKYACDCLEYAIDADIDQINADFNRARGAA